MTDTGRIPIPWRLRRDWFLRRLLPFAWFLATFWLAALLWQRSAHEGNLVGEVEVVRVEVPASRQGTLVSLPQGHWTLFDVVVKDQVVARVNDMPLRAELSTMEVQRLRLRQELAATQSRLLLDQRDLQQDRQQELMRLTWHREQLRLDVLDRAAQIAVDGAELQRLEARLDYYQRLASKNAVTRFDLEQTQLQRDVVTRRIAENRKSILEANRQRTVAADRIAEFPAETVTQLDPILEPLRTAVSVQESRIRQVELEMDQLQVRAPISGVISAIHSWPGQTVQLGQAVVTISADHGRYVVGYLREDQPLDVSAQTQVAVRRRGSPATRFVATHVERVGPQVEPVPLHHLSDPARPEWGLPIRIAIPAQLRLPPGTLVDVRIPRT